MAVTVKSPVFCEVTLYSVEVNRDNVLEANLLCFYFDIEDGDSIFLRNVGNTSEDSTLHSHVNSEFAL
jgi:hypothetical protein